MATSAATVTRWLAIPVIALLGAAVAQVVVFKGIGALTFAVSGEWPGSTGTWAAKTVTSIFMGAAFVALAWAVAPRAKQFASLLAFGIVLLWGGRLITSAFEHGFFVWLLAMGLAGIAGGACALWLGHRGAPARP